MEDWCVINVCSCARLSSIKRYIMDKQNPERKPHVSKYVKQLNCKKLDNLYHENNYICSFSIMSAASEELFLVVSLKNKFGETNRTIKSRKSN